MTIPPTAPRTDRPSLDPFESALLTELREHVAAHPVHATATAPVPHRRHRGRWAAGLAVAAAAATAFVVGSPGGPATSPAYAVEQTGAGDVVVIIHRLEDSAGLEKALSEHGIDADVSFDPGSTKHGISSFTVPDGEVGEVPSGSPERGSTELTLEPDAGKRQESGGQSQQAEPAAPGEVPDIPDCGIATSDPATLTHEGDDWVLRIPAESPLQNRPVAITTGADGALGVFYAGNEPGSYCGVMSVG